MKFDYLRL